MKHIIAFAAALALSLFSLSAQDTSALLKKGAKAPDFTLTSDKGKKVSLSDFKGKYIVIDFWASWCKDCRKENPEMVKLYKKYKKVRFIGVSFDTDENKWKECIAQDGLEWTQVSELKKWKETQISKEYGINWIPTFYLIDPQGRVAAACVTAGELAAELEKIK